MRNKSPSKAIRSCNGSGESAKSKPLVIEVLFLDMASPDKFNRKAPIFRLPRFRRYPDTLGGGDPLVSRFLLSLPSPSNIFLDNVILSFHSHSSLKLAEHR